MPNFVNNTITINGEGQIAAALAKKQLVITRVQVGAGIATMPLPSLTALLAPVMNLTPVPPQVSANNLQIGEVVVMAVLDTANVAAAFQLTELGVFATSAGGPEQLIAYCQCSSPYDTIAPGSGSNRLILNLQVPIVVGLGASVSITVQAGNPVYIPPVVAGPGIVVDAPTDTSGRVIKWIVSTPQITQNTTLYVANEYTQNVAPYFSSLQNAVNYLSSFTIASGAGVWINMAAEQFNISQAVYINHVNASQITIQGANNPDISFNGIGAITGSAGWWQVQLLNVSSTVNIKPGLTWLNIWYVGFNWMQPLVSGTFQVLSVSGSTVTIGCYYYGTSWPNMAGTSGIMTPLNTLIVATSGTIGYALDLANGIGLLQYIAFLMPGGYTNNYPATGVVVTKGTASFRYVGTWGFRGNTALGSGIAVGGPASAYLQCCSSSFNDNGYISSGAGANLIGEGVCSTHNLNRGYWAEGSASISFIPGIYNTPNYVSGNRERGLLISDSSYCCVTITYSSGQLWEQPLMISYNASYGLHMWNQSRTAFGTARTVFWLAYNTNYDIVLSCLSSTVGSAYIQGTRIFNGTPGVLMADGSYFG